MKRAFWMALLLGGVVLAGCATGPKLANSFEDIAGAWQNADGTGPVFIYHEDGSIQCGFTLQEAEAASGCDANAWFDGTEYHTVNPNFCDGAEGIYQVQLLENGNYKFLLVQDDGCPDRISFFVGDEGDVEYTLVSR